MPGCILCDCNFLPFLVEFTYQTRDAATGAASIIVNDEGMCLTCECHRLEQTAHFQN